MDFLMVQAPSTYNAILGCLGLNMLQAIVSTNYLKMKFLKEFGVSKVYGDQALARQCYNIALHGVGPSEAYPIDGLDTQDELFEE